MHPYISVVQVISCKWCFLLRWYPASSSCSLCYFLNPQILAFVLIRNIPGYARSLYSSFFAWFGKISLEVRCLWHEQSFPQANSAVRKSLSNQMMKNKSVLGVCARCVWKPGQPSEALLVFGYCRWWWNDRECNVHAYRLTENCNPLDYKEWTHTYYPIRIPCVGEDNRLL